MSPSQENYSVPSGTEAIPYVCFAASQGSLSRVIPFSSHQFCSFMHQHFFCICSETAKPTFMGNSLKARQKERKTQGEEGAGLCVLHFHGKGGRIKTTVWVDGPGRWAAVGSTREGQQPDSAGAGFGSTGLRSRDRYTSWEGQI